MDGWKEISAYLKRSVRTVQRWEASGGLPVGRIGTPGGEVVFAFRRDIDEWLRRETAAGRDPDRGEPAPDARATPAVPVEPIPIASPARRRWIPPGRIARYALLATVVAAAAWAAYAPYTAGTSGQPARWEPDDAKIRVLANDGRHLCDIPFGIPIVLSEYEATPRDQRIAADLRTAPDLTPLRKVEIADLDGDGAREVAVVVKAQDRTKDAIHLYDRTCHLLWERSAETSVTVGDTTYDPPFWMLWVLTTPDPEGGRALWLSRRHTKYFPAVLERLDAQGRVIGEFWHAGEITALASGRLNGRSVVAVGGVNNERRLPFVALFNDGSVGGVGPAERAEYRFASARGPARAGPLHYVLFPDSRLGALGPGMRSVSQITFNAGWLSVEIPQYGLDAPRPGVVGAVSFDLDASGQALHVELTDGYRDVYAAAHGRGLLTEPFDPREGASLQGRLLFWDGNRFSPAPVAKAASH